MLIIYCTKGFASYRYYCRLIFFKKQKLSCTLHFSSNKNKQTLESLFLAQNVELNEGEHYFFLNDRDRI